MAVFKASLEGTRRVFGGIPSFLKTDVSARLLPLNVQ